MESMKRDENYTCVPSESSSYVSWSSKGLFYVGMCLPVGSHINADDVTYID